MSTDLEKLIILYPNVEWDWECLSRNPNISLDFIEKSKNIFSKGTPIFNLWYWYTGISYNPNITSKFVEKYKDKDWNFNFISSNIKLTIDFIEKFSNKLEWSEICLNNNFTLDMIEKYKLSKYYLSSNPNITFDFVKKNLPYDDWNWYDLCKNKNIYLSDEWIRENLLFIDWRGISSNPNITFDFVEKHLDKLDIYNLSWNKSLDLRIVEKYPDLSKIERLFDPFGDNNSKKDWVWRGLLNNPNITIEFINSHISYFKHQLYFLMTNTYNIPIEIVENNIDEMWDWEILSSNLNVNIEFINKYKDKFYWRRVSRNPAIGLKEIEKYDHLPWDQSTIFLNPNITFEYIVSRINENKNVNWYYLSDNNFKFNKDLKYVYINKLKKIRKKVTSFKIKKWYKLYLLTKTQKFWKWYCAPGNIGNKVDKKRIMDHFERLPTNEE